MVDIEDLITPRPSIFLYILQNSFTVAKSIRNSYKDVSNWIGNLVRKNLVAKHSLTHIEGEVKEIWNKLHGKGIVFIDGGLGKTQIFTHTPIFIRVGIFKIKPGEMDMSKREDFDFYPIFLGDLESGLKSRSDYSEVVRILSELAALWRVIFSEKYSDVAYVIIHGPLLYRLSAFTKHKFTLSDYTKIFNMNEDAFRKILEKFYPTCKCETCSKKEIRAICMIKFLLQEIFEHNKLKDFNPIIISVVEGVGRGTPPPKEYTLNYLLPEIVKIDPTLTEKIFGVQISEPLEEQLKEISSRLQLNDMILLSLALKENEFTEPFDAIERYSGFTQQAGLTEFAKDLVANVPIRYSYLKSFDNSFAFRVEFPGLYSKDKILDGLEKILVFSRLLPNYAFPLGLDIVDKFARVPNWLIEGYRKYIFGNLAMVTEKQDVLDEDIKRALLFMIINRRDFFLRPHGG